MFPYARDNVRKHLSSTFDSEETKDDIKLLRIQVSTPSGSLKQVILDIDVVFKKQLWLQLFAIKYL